MLTFFTWFQVVASIITAVLLTVIFRKTDHAMAQRWRRLHTAVLVPFNVGFYLMVIRRLTAVSLVAYPHIAVYDQVVLPGLISACFLAGILAGYREITREREYIELRQEFIKHASHELNTPLAIIMGNVENALAGVYPNDDHSLAWEKTQQGARRMRWLIENFMYMLILQNGEIDMGPLNLADTVASSVEEMTEKANYRQAKVDVKTEKSVIVSGNGRLLKAALTNLIDNAIKFAADTDIQVTVLLYRDGKTAVVEVIDNGIGVAPTKQREIFDAFRQGDGSDTRRYGGIGIGLWIVQQVARLHGGRVEIESMIGYGSTFRLVMPVGGRDG